MKQKIKNKQIHNELTSPGRHLFVWAKKCSDRLIDPYILYVYCEQYNIIV